MHLLIHKAETWFGTELPLLLRPPRASAATANRNPTPQPNGLTHNLLQSRSFTFLPSRTLFTGVPRPPISPSPANLFPRRHASSLEQVPQQPPEDPPSLDSSWVSCCHRELERVALRGASRMLSSGEEKRQ